MSIAFSLQTYSGRGNYSGWETPDKSGDYTKF